jgi:hypothetical protein
MARIKQLEYNAFEKTYAIVCVTSVQVAVASIDFIPYEWT